MTRYGRTPRRQGVVYGPVLGHGQGDGSSLAGRLLGAAVVLGALVLMAGVTYMFLGPMQAPVAAPSPAPTGVAVASPSPASTPAVSPTPTPEPTPEVTPTQTTEPEPTPVVVEVREGPGYITFGSGWDRSHNMNNVRATFTPGGRIAWSAVTAEPVGVPTLNITVHKLNLEEGTEELMWEDAYQVENQESQRFLRRVRLNVVTDGLGVYVMRYLRDGEVISEGFFEVATEGGGGEGDDDDEGNDDEGNDD